MITRERRPRGRARRSPRSYGRRSRRGGYLGSGYDLRPRRYWEFDLFRPEQQSFPASLAEVAAAGFSSNVLAGWACQETGGTTLADFSGNARTLTKGGSATASLIGQRVVGLFDGASFRSQRGVEIVGGATNADGFTVASAAGLGSNWVDPFSVLVEIRPNNITAGSLVGKFGGAYWIVSTNATGNVIGTVYDGVTAVSVTITGNHADGAPHWAYLRFDPVSDILSGDSDITTGLSSSTAAISNALANTGLFSVGGIAGGGAPATSQLRGCIVFGDVSTTVASIQAWWRHGRAPSWLTYARASSFHGPVADDATEGDVLATWASGQIAYEYNALISTNPLKLGMPADPAHTQLIPGSDLNDATNWPATGTKTTYDQDSPRGFREGIAHTKTAANQSVLCSAANGAAVTAATVYTASTYVWWDGLVTAPGIDVMRADGTTLIASVNATDGTGKRRRISVTFTAPATESVRISYRGSAAASTTGTGRFFGPQINTENYAKPYIHTKAATASTVAIVARASVPGLTSDRGTIKVWATFRHQDAAGYRVIAAAVQTAGSNTSERAMGIDASEQLWFSAAAFDFQGGVQADLATVETVLVGKWDKAESRGWSASVHRNGGAALTSAIDLAAVTPTEVLYLGVRADGMIGHVGGISKVRVWRTPEASA